MLSLELHEEFQHYSFLYLDSLESAAQELLAVTLRNGLPQSGECAGIIYTTLFAAKNFIGSHNDCIHLPDLFQLKSMKSLTNLDFDTKCFELDSVITRPRHDR